MVQWAKVLDSKPKDLSSIPRTHTVTGRTSSSKLSFDSLSGTRQGEVTKHLWSQQSTWSPRCYRPTLPGRPLHSTTEGQLLSAVCYMFAIFL